jgi:hypothetical protein
MNYLERLRDPSHVRLWRAAELEGFLQRARPALELVRPSAADASGMDNEVTFDQWLGVTAHGESKRSEIVQALEADLNAATDDTGMRVTRGRDGGLQFLFSYAFRSARRA